MPEEIKQITAPTGSETQFEANQRVADLEVPATIDDSTEDIKPLLTDDYKQSVAKLTTQPEIKPEPTTPQEASEFREDTVVTNANKAPTKSNKVAKKDIAEYDFSESLKDVFKKGVESGKTRDELINGFKSRLEGAGFDTTNFDQTYSSTIDSFESLNQTQDDFYKGIQNGESYGKFYEKNSADYQAAKVRVDAFNKIQKTPAGIKLAINSGVLVGDSTLFKDLMAVPEYAAIIKQTQKNILEDKISDTKNLNDLTFGELEEITDAYNNKYTFDASVIEDDINNDVGLTKDKEDYLKFTADAVSIKTELNSLRGSIDAKYPNASESFKATIYNREAVALQSKLNEATEGATLSANAYEFRMAEKQMIWDAEQIEVSQRKEIFTDLFNKKWGDDRLATQEQWKADREKLSNKDVVTWKTNDDGQLTGINKQGEIVSTLDGYTPLEGSKAKLDTYKQEWADGTGYSIITISEDGAPSEVKFRYDGEELVKSEYVEGLGTITSLGNRVEGDNGLDISSPLGTDIPAKSNVTVTETGFDDTFGNWIKVEDTEGNTIRYSHLQNKSTWKKGDIIGVGNTIGQVGNTGYTFTADGNGGWREPTEQELLAGKGAHIDIGSWDAEGNMRSGLETKDFLSGVIADGEFTGDIVPGTTRDLVNRMGGTTALSGALAKSVFGSRPSDEESARADRIIQEGMDKPYTQLKEELAGYVILSGNEELGDSLKNKLRTKLTDISLAAPVLSTLSDSINEGRDGDAIRAVENSIIETVSENNRVNESTVKFSIDKVNELEALITKASLNEAIGPIEGTMETWLSKFKDTELAGLETKIVPLISEMRHRLSGTAVTESETLFLEPLVPDIKDTAEKFNQKLLELKSIPVNELNRFRNGLQLPSLSEGQIGNETLEDRVDLYVDDNISVTPVFTGSSRNKSTGNGRL